MKLPFKFPKIDLSIPVITGIFRLLRRVSIQNEYIIQQNERMIDIMTTSFQALLDEAKAQGAQLDKVLAEVQEGNASAVTPEQLDELKSVLDSNKGKIQNIDDARPDKTTDSPTEPAPPAEEVPAPEETV